MICVNCRAKIEEIRTDGTLDVHVRGLYDGRVSVIENGVTLSLHDSISDALAELMRRYGRGK